MAEKQNQQENSKTPKNKKKARREGLVGFDIQEVKRLSESDEPNAEAYGYLYQAVSTSPGTKSDIDDVYPESAEETARMRELVDKADKAIIDESDTYIKCCLIDLEDILDWSGRRHWTIMWPVIIGVILTVIFLSWRVDKKQEDVEDRQAVVAAVENWEEADTVLVWESTPDQGDAGFELAKYGHQGPVMYKYLTLCDKKISYTRYMKSSEEYAAKADTARSKETRRSLEKQSKEYASAAEDYRKEFDEINAMGFKKIQKMALDEYGSWLKSSKADKRAVRAWNIFFILLIPVYIFSQRPYGYTITRTRAESSTLKGISKWTYAVSAMLAGSALSIPYIDTIIKYRDGRVERTSDAGTNAPVVALKVALYIAAFALVCIVSCLLMLYMTIQGLRRNYNWAPLLSKVRGTVSSGIDKMKTNSNNNNV